MTLQGDAVCTEPGLPGLTSPSQLPTAALALVMPGYTTKQDATSPMPPQGQSEYASRPVSSAPHGYPLNCGHSHLGASWPLWAPIPLPPLPWAPQASSSPLGHLCDGWPRLWQRDTVQEHDNQVWPLPRGAGPVATSGSPTEHPAGPKDP